MPPAAAPATPEIQAQIARILAALEEGLANYHYLPPPPGYWPEARGARGGDEASQVPQLPQQMQEDFLRRMARWLPTAITAPMSEQQLADIEEGLLERAYAFEMPGKFGYGHAALLRMVCSTQTAIWRYIADGPDPQELIAIQEQLGQIREAMMDELLRSWPDCPAEVREGAARMADVHFGDLTASALWTPVRSVLPEEEATDLTESLERLIVLEPGLRVTQERPLERLAMAVSWVSSWGRGRAREAGRADSAESRELAQIEQEREAELQARYELVRKLNETDPGWRERRRLGYTALTRAADHDAFAFTLAPIYMSARVWSMDLGGTAR
ncbi:MAG: hypothetical protein ACE5R4_18785 [Armatimonadota bacterium]